MSLASYIGFGETASLPLARLFAQRPMSQRRTNSIVRRTYQEVGEKLSDFGKEVLGNVGKKGPTKLYDQNAHYKRLSDKLGSNSNPALKELVNRAGNGNNAFARNFLKKAQAAVPKARIEGQGQPEPIPGYTADSIAAAAFSAFALPPATEEELAAAAAKTAKKEATKAKAAATKAANKAAREAAATAAAAAAAAGTAAARAEKLDTARSELAAAKAAAGDSPTDEQKKEIKRLENREKKAAKKAAESAPKAAAPPAAAAPEPAAAAAAPEPAAAAAVVAAPPEPAPADTTDGLEGDEKDNAAAIEGNSAEDNKDPKTIKIIADSLPLLKDAEIGIDTKTKKVQIIAWTQSDGMKLSAALVSYSQKLTHHPKYRSMILGLSRQVFGRYPDAVAPPRPESSPSAAVGGGGSSAAAAPTAATGAIKGALAEEGFTLVDSKKKKGGKK
jgi:hypothetical protein